MREINTGFETSHRQKAFRLADELGIEIIVGYDKFDSRKIVEIELLAPDGYWWENDGR